jgi:hypothetical protein
MREKIENELCQVNFDPDEKQVVIYDKTDGNNLPAAMTTKKRGVPAAWAEIRERFTAETTFGDVWRILKDEKQIMTHYWCRMD